MLLPTSKYTIHTTGTANAFTPTSWVYSFVSHTPERHSKLGYHSRLEKSFLLDNGPSISALN